MKVFLLEMTSIPSPYLKILHEYALHYHVMSTGKAHKLETLNCPYVVVCPVCWPCENLVTCLVLGIDQPSRSVGLAQLAKLG